MTEKEGSVGQHRQHHQAIVLFYKYFLSCDFEFLHANAFFYVQRLQEFLESLCEELELKGRLLIAAEGINGTVSAYSRTGLQEFIDRLEAFELVQSLGMPNGITEVHKDYRDHHLFTDIDWKISSTNDTTASSEPFPDMKVAIVNEIISSGNAISVEDLKDYGGGHLEPKEFHKVLTEDDNVLLIDVRNNFEYDIGHFVNPKTNEAAMNPNTMTFAAFDSSFCNKHADQLKDKKVLMYCTGGIRCEKASAMLRKRGVEKVSQLKGGIHRYIEEYGEYGYFRGKNFVFDGRVAIDPVSASRGSSENDDEDPKSRSKDIIGRCFNCNAPYDEFSGSRVCTVCRELVLTCENCQTVVREYHCRRHLAWKTCYFTFLEIFDEKELIQQREELTKLLSSLKSKKARKTISRQIEKVSSRLEQVQSGEALVDRNAARCCRSCFKLNSICDGNCWGFWVHLQSSRAEEAKLVLADTCSS